MELHLDLLVVGLVLDQLSQWVLQRVIKMDLPHQILFNVDMGEVNWSKNNTIQNNGNTGTKISQ